MVIRTQGRKKSLFPAHSEIPSSATLDFVSGGVNYQISLADFLTALNVTGSIVQDGNSLGVPILDTQAAVNNIRNLEVSSTSGLSAEVSAENGITLEFDAQVASGSGTAVLSSTNKIRNIKAGSGCTVTLSGDDIVITVP